MIKVLVTGGAGYIGSHTCYELAKNGYEVFAIDSLINGYSESINRINTLGNYQKGFKKIKFFKLNLCNYSSLNEFFRSNYINKIEFDGVIHFAGLKAVAESVLDPISYWENNLISTLNLLKIVQDYKIRSFVFSSSATVYDSRLIPPFSENAKLNPINPYGETKLAIEKILNQLSFASCENINIATLRYFNPIGAHESSLIGEFPKGTPNNIFPILCKVANGELNEFHVYGNNWNTRDGTCIRDYIHVMDVAIAHKKTLEYLDISKNVNLTLNLGTGKGTSVIELINAFENANSLKIKYIFKDRRPGDVAEIYADTTLAKKILGWETQRNLNQMCVDGWNWKIKNPNGY